MEFSRKYGVAAVIDGVPLVTRGAQDFKASPTLAAGDAKVEKDGGAAANLTTLPAVTPAGGTSVRISLSATEMQAARVVVTLIDQTATKEWEDQKIIIKTFGHASATEQMDYTDGAGAGLSRLDAAISTRLASASYTTPPTAAAIADQVWDELSTDHVTANTTGLAQNTLRTNIGNLDAAVSSRLASASYTAPDNSSISTLTSRLTSGRASNLDNLDASVSSRLASASYTTPPTAAAIADAVWDELTADHQTANTAGLAQHNLRLNVGNLDAAISTRLASASYTAPPSAAAIADQVWDEALAGHLGAGSTGAALNAAGGAGDPWATALPGAYGAGTAGNILGNRLDLAVSTRLASASYTAPPTAAAIADQVWDEASADHVAAGSTGEQQARLDVGVGTRLASASYTAPDNAGITTLTGRLTAGRASNLDNLDAAVSSRLASASYTAPPTAAAIADAVWDELTTDHVTASTAGRVLDDLRTRVANLDASVSSRLASAGYTAPDNASIATLVTRLTAGRAAGLDNLDAAISTRLASASYTAPPTVGQIADQVWDELSADHVAIGSTGKLLSDAGSNTDPWATALPGGYGEGTAGEVLGNLAADLAATHGGGAWDNAGSGDFGVTIHVKDLDDVPIEAARVTVRNSAGTTLLRFAVTDADGNVAFNLNAGTYKVYITTGPGYQPIPVQTIVVAGVAALSYTLQAQLVPPPSSALMCRVFGFIRDTQDLPVENAEVTFRLNTTGVAEVQNPGVAFLMKRTVTVPTDEFGYFFADLLRSSEINPHTAGVPVTYTVSCAQIDLANVPITVPDEETFDLVEELPLA